MKRHSFPRAILVGILGLILGIGGTFAATTDKHSDSLQVLANLQLAKALLGKDKAAIAEISAAIAELKKSTPSLAKTKPLALTANKMDRAKRFQEVIKLLAKARQEIKDERGEPAALKAKLESHVEKAYKIIDDQTRHSI